MAKYEIHMFITFGMSRALQLERRAGVSTILRRSIRVAPLSGTGLFETNKMQEDEIICKARGFMCGEGENKDR